ncbi:MAG: HAD-IB family phosphatase [Bacteroidetes bacterium]|nr:HAD-IB family phosphatase [Bacteroidota bacterium]
MKQKVFKIFMDFDGTVTQQDVGEELFRKFAEEEKVNKIIDDLLNDRISSRECWIKLCSAVPSVNKNEFDDFIVSIPLDPTFVTFQDYCKNENIELYILSDGFDYYISKILEKNEPFSSRNGRGAAGAKRSVNSRPTQHSASTAIWLWTACTSAKFGVTYAVKMRSTMFRRHIPRSS